MSPRKPKITRKDLDRYWQLEEQRKALEQQARTLKAAAKALEDQFKQALEEAGIREHVVADYRVALVEGRPSVSWKTQFIRVAGAEAAQKLLEHAVRPIQVAISKVASAAAVVAARKSA